MMMTLKLRMSLKRENKNKLTSLHIIQMLLKTKTRSMILIIDLIHI